MSKASKPLVLAALALFAAACSTQATPESLDDVAQHVVVPARETALYAGICGFSLASYDPKYAIRFYAESTFTPTDGSLTLALTPLIGWNAAENQPEPPAAVSHDLTRGDRITTTSAVTNGAFSARYAALDIQPEANSINGVTARVETLQLDGTFGTGDRFCAGFSGKLTVPLDYEFLRDENTCLFIKVHEGDPLPPVEAADFHCP
jgi:hypothetical protein